ncbi:PREDICTED: plastidial pyruvate kinase 4, chloroplastic [Nelumbo nucifera]|uniref:pyruvate kinase n=1 Tax=Nelumbo nucifera TaxID=4432 RepID=A0A1U8ATN5_NELNU|nr:PREDICTED: plastidial pyruvate kinase 4, chloroplastic [Nelumbo nucifera]
MLHALSVHSTTSQCSPQSHGSNASDFTSHNRKFLYPMCRFYLKSSDYGYYFSPLLANQKRYLTPRLIVSATLNGKDEPERSSVKPQTNGETRKIFSLDSGSIQIPKDPNLETVASTIESEMNLPECAENPVNQGNLLDKLKALHLHVLAMEQWNACWLKLCHRNYLVSVTNLMHYLALKCLDVEQLKDDLCSVGLLNLETINPNVLASITASIQILENLKSNSLNSKENIGDGIYDMGSSDRHKKADFTITTMRKKALCHRESLLGSLRDGRTTHIMVTVGEEATESETLIADLLKEGATIFRINCAHGDPGVWSEIIRRVKRSSQMLEKPCRILMELAGPKLRTGPMKVGPCVMKISPEKDASGNVTFPAQVWLCYKGSGPPPSHLSINAVLHIDDQEFLNGLEIGNVLRFHDARGKRRMLKISQKSHVFTGIGCIAECSNTAYVESGTELYKKGKKGRVSVGQVVDVPAVEQFIRLRIGDLLIISRDSSLTAKDVSDKSADDVPQITCSSGHLFDSVKPGDPIAFDDGKIWGVVQGTSISEILVSITHAGIRGSKLGAGKSINIPESNIQFEGLTSKDLVDLEFVAAHADMVGISFIRDIRDVVVLCQELEKRNLSNIGIVLKIETKGGFEKLPLLLLQAMQAPNPVGVMIARGDLAVECGWERLADIQEEILSICNAAHIPVIWATQVLESLVKSGLPTRAEITDVANGKKASCIMLNKGKYISKAVSTLDSILNNSSRKVNAELKPLVLSSRLL